MTPLEVFKKIREAGFEGVEVCASDKGGLINPQTTRAECDRLLAQADEAGIEIIGLMWGLNGRYRLTASEPEIRGKAKMILKTGIQLGAWLRLPQILAIPGGHGSRDKKGDLIPYETCVKKGAEMIRSGLKTSEKLNCGMALEYVWNSLLLSPIEYRDFIDQFDSPLIGFYMDTGNMLNTSPAEEWIRTMGKRVMMVHLKDWKKAIGGWRGFVDLTEGDCNFPAVMKELRRIRYKGPLTAEYGDLEPEHLLKISRTVDKIMEM